MGLLTYTDKRWTNPGREVQMRALLCSCKHRLAASDNEELLKALVDHLSEHHPVMTFSEEQIRELVAARSYKYNEVVVVGANPEEEFGFEPY
jgi:predicted small metal-binding protein